jgi:HEAT repeat protein
LTPDQPHDDKLTIDPTEDRNMSKHPVIRLHLLLLAAMLLLGSIARAQDYLADPNLPSPKHWEGPSEEQLDPQPTMKYPSRENIEDALTRARFLREVSRDFVGAARELNQLWLPVNFYHGFEAEYGQFDGALTLYTKNLDDVMRARIESLQVTGEYQAAARLAAYPYFHAADSWAHGQNIAGMGEELSRAILERAFSPWWDAKRTELDAIIGQEPADRLGKLSKEQKAYVAEHFGRSSTELADRVRKAVSEGDMDVTTSLGLRATPALAELILADLEGTQFALELDPLYALAMVDPSGACRLASDHFDAGGQSFRLRVLNMVETYRPFIRNDVWDYPAPYQVGNQTLSHPPRCQVPFWIDLIAKLASDRRTRARVYGLVDVIATRDALTTAMQQSLIAALKESDERDALNVLANLDTGAPIDSVKPVLESAMQHKSAKVRLAAAHGLLNFADSTALLAAAQDSDVEVRRVVARSFVSRSVPRANYDNPRTGNQSFTMTVYPQVDLQRSATLAKLLEDSDEEVRTIAAEALPQQDWNFTSGAPYLAAAKTNDSEVIGFLLRASYPNRQVQMEVLSTIWNSSSKPVLSELDKFLSSSADWRMQPEIWGPALLARATNTKSPFLSGRDFTGVSRSQRLGPIEALASIMDTDLDRNVGGTIVAIMIATELQDVQLLGTALNASESFVAEALSTLTLDSMAELAQLAFEGSTNSRAINLIAAALAQVDWKQNNAEPFLAFVKDPRRDKASRLVLAHALVEGGSESALKVAFQMLAKEGIETTNEFSLAAFPFQAASPELQLDYANQALERSEEDPALALALGVALGLNGDQPALFAAAVLNPALHGAYSMIRERDSGSLMTCGRALRVLLDDPEWSERDQELLVAAMSSDNSRLHIPAILFARRTQDGRNIPLLGSLMRSGTDSQQQLLLVTALGSFMSRDAGQELVQSLGAAADPNVRGAIQQQLSQIRGYLEEEAYWAGSEKQRATQESAIAELIEMLDDADSKIRTAALDGLASFGAKEHLPRIIRMLNDESNQVQRAAKNAVRLLQHGISSLDEGDE